MKVVVKFKEFANVRSTTVDLASKELFAINFKQLANTEPKFVMIGTLVIPTDSLISMEILPEGQG